jgi:hypothetical protein
MDYYENVMVHYLRSDRAIFVNSESCIQLNQASNPDKSGLHWYCDAVAADFRNQTIFLCEISYGKGLTKLRDRLKGWHDNWEKVCFALMRDSFVNKDWPVRPWIFLPEEFVPLLMRRFNEISAGQPLKFAPRVTPLEMIQPWRFQSWNRIGEMAKPATVPEAMQN